MTEHQPDQARFDHVDETGALVFAAGEARFVVQVDDTLERAILEAKQIASESGGARRRPSGQSLPISQIQALIRAGAEPSRVAERYELSEALVRRFSAAVETEKQYAIEQFLSVPAPKDSRMHTVSDLIERTLAAARVRPGDVQWRATRRGLEPWRISAQFTSAGRTIRAEWTWNMHDNAVVCMNRTAKILLGEQNLDKQGSTISSRKDAAPGDDEGFSVAIDLPGDSARSARIEQAVSAWSAPEPSMPAARPEPRTQPAAGDAAGDGDTPRSPASEAGADGDAAGGQTERQDNPPATKPAKRRSGRSAVPSWDEILFGD
ncbi:septation protein SepH [Bifidobacterium phasiani]|uniref:DUF3071 domain-containing protein n=1 Tax=Bifidobacterium phasiani TaxID=2834431 RepID=A0ABS6W719_9BIFI|nr:septation protein SepH [Bifidobacterium phasiani]MBW3082293.1 DUF3071 domain-containing protein [Bifidobacterium phasiani]